MDKVDQLETRSKFEETLDKLRSEHNKKISEFIAEIRRLEDEQWETYLGL